MYRKSIYIQKKWQWSGDEQNIIEWKQNTIRKYGKYQGFTRNVQIYREKMGKIGEGAVARPACQDLPNFCRLRYPFRCSAYYVPLNSFSLLESIWLR